MILKQEIKKYISILLISFLIFQILPGTYSNFKDLEFCESKYLPFLSKKIVYTNNTNVNERVISKSAFRQVSADISVDFCGDVFSPVILEDKSLHYVLLEDFRAKIKQLVPNYFFGSKYKSI